MTINQELEGRYEVLAKLGEGGMGAVYKLRHRLLGTICVAKILRDSLEDSDERRQRFLREARVAGQLRHPNIAQVTDFSVDHTGFAFLVMEYVEGIDLEELITQVGLPGLSLTVEIARQGLAALGHIHARQLVHRDISPDNLMLTRSEDGLPLVKLIDLGIATSVLGDSRLTATGLFIGKPHYAAPEQFGGASGHTTADARSDLYAFGVVLYRLLTGHFPIVGRDHRAIIAGHLVRPPVPFAETDPEGRVPDTVRATVLKALEKRPEDRFQSARDFAAALEAAAGAATADSDDVRRQVAVVAERAQAITGRSVPCGSTSLQGPVRIDLPELPTRTGPAGGVTAPPEVEATSLLPGTPARATRITAPPRPPAFATVPAAEATVLEPTPAPGRRRRVAATVAILAATAATVAVLALPSLRQRQVAAPATLVIDAVPWAEVATVRAANGEAIALARPSYTPLRLALPAGSYRVELRHRDFGARTVTVELATGATTEQLVRFTETPASELLGRLGL